MEPTPSQTLPKTPRKPARVVSFNINFLWAALAVVLIAFTILWIWKNNQLKAQAKKFEARETELVATTNAALDSGQVHFLKLVAKPYVWAIRTEMMQGNLAQVNLYGSDIVKEKNFVSVMIADEAQKVVAATDKKFEGQPLSSLGTQVNANADATSVVKLTDSLYQVSSPIMSFNSRLGTLIINYRAADKMILKPAETTE